MTNSDQKLLSSVLMNRFSARFEVSSTVHGRFELELNGHSKEQFFWIELDSGLHHQIAELRFGSFSGDILSVIRNLSPEEFGVGVSVLKSAKATGIQIFVGSEEEFDLANLWRLFQKKTPPRISCIGKTKNEGDGDSIVPAFVSVSVPLLGFILTLLASEEGEPASFKNEAGGLPEGARSKVLVNKYERSAANRAAAIAIHGSVCQVCTIDFGSVYGPMGVGFIHVHHVIPISNYLDNYFVDPEIDLVPVCPNCHAMLHTTNPPMALEKLRAVMGDQKK
jgi:5-methylcytosine-specific restriction enzyme A